MSCSHAFKCRNFVRELHLALDADVMDVEVDIEKLLDELDDSGATPSPVARRAPAISQPAAAAELQVGALAPSG
eukprot:5978723-Prymnesium_polylepis.1